MSDRQPTRARRRLRVTIVNPYGLELFAPQMRASRQFGGAEVQLRYLSKALVTDHGMEVTMLVEQPVTGECPSIIDGVHFVTVPRSQVRDRVREHLPLPARAYREAICGSRPDVVVQRGGAVLTVDASIAARHCRAKFIFMAAHDWDCSLAHRRPGQLINGQAFIWAMRRADLTIAQSDAQAYDLAMYHGIWAPVLRSGLPRVEATIRYASPTDPLLWVGRGLSWKRPELMLDVAAALPDRPVMIVCSPYPGSSDLIARLKHRAADIPNVVWVDGLRFDQADQLYKQAAAIINTSTAEGYPNTFLQAARVGTPLASLEKDSDGIIDRHGLGVVGDGDVDLFVKRLRHLLEPTCWVAASAAARTYFRTQHEIGVVAGRLAQLIHTVVGDVV